MKSKNDLWMPLYIGDYLRDTMHLSHDQHGVYLLLLFHYWVRRQPLPDDDACLAQVTKLSLQQWLSYKPSILHFFSCVDGKLVHKRVEQELAKAAKLREARSKGGKTASNERWSAKNAAQLPSQLPLSALPSYTQSQSQSHIGTGTSSDQGVQGEQPPPPPLPPPGLDNNANGPSEHLSVHQPSTINHQPLQREGRGAEAALNSQPSTLNSPREEAALNSQPSTLNSPPEAAPPDHPPTHVTHAHSCSLTTPSARFERPTLAQVAARAAELGLLPIEAEKFFNHYESNGWKVGRNPMKSWPHALQNWKNNTSLYANHSTNRRPGPDRSAGTANAGTASQYKLG